MNAPIMKHYCILVVVVVRFVDPWKHETVVHHGCFNLHALLIVNLGLKVTATNLNVSPKVSEEPNMCTDSLLPSKTICKEAPLLWSSDWHSRRSSITTWFGASVLNSLYALRSSTQFVSEKPTRLMGVDESAKKEFQRGGHHTVPW